MSLKRSWETDSEWASFLKKYLFLSLILHVVAAYFSKGFYHPDEHFQILEFVSYQLGISPIDSLALEFQQSMRPWLFPGFLTLLAKGLGWIGLGAESPFALAFVFRLFSSLLGWVALGVLSLRCYTWFPDQKSRRWAVLASNFLWLIPAFHARPSSENVAGSLFLIGLCLLEGAVSSGQRLKAWGVSISAWRGLGVGILFGISFEVRYQMALLLVGTLAWLLVVAKARWSRLIPIGIGFGIVLGLGTLVDSWGYGQWTWAPWNYFRHNLIEGKVSAFDSSPWWDYFRKSLTESWPVLGFVTLMSYPLSWILFPRHLLTWVAVPFFVFHFGVGHKELRFLLPVAHFAGVVFVLCLSNPRVRKIFQWARGSKPLRWRGFWVGLNGAALLTLSIIPAWMPIGFYEHLNALAQSKPWGEKFVIHTNDIRFENIGGAHMRFYLPPNLEVLPLPTQRIQKTLWVFNGTSLLPEPGLPSGMACLREFSMLPSWLTGVIESPSVQARFPRISNWTLFRCQPGRP